MLDTNVYHKLIDDEPVLAWLRHLVGSGVWRILGTHVQRDELARGRDADTRRRLDCFDSLATVVPTDVFVFDVSRFDQAGLGPTVGTVEELDTVLRTPAAGRTDGTPGHTNDAIIIQTARAEGAILVTNEQGRMIKSAPKVGIEVVQYPDFVNLIMSPASGD